MFKLYIGLSPYWHAAKELDELSRYWYRRFCCLFKRVLFTYYDSSDFEKWGKFISFRTHKIELMFDSGAFSVWKAGEGKVNLEKLIDYDLKLQEKHSFKSVVFVSLDRIPGTLKRSASPSEVSEAAEVSLQNYLRMKERGLKIVLPVYHLGEDRSCLKKIIESGADYIGLGGLARGAGNNARRRWLEPTFDFLRKYSEIKIHGFGVTSSRLVWDYPWYSVDSVSSRMTPGYGCVEVFDKEQIRMRRAYIQGIRSYIKVPDEFGKKWLSNYFEIDYNDLKNLWCRAYFSMREWMKFERFVRNHQKKGLQKPLQKSLFGE